MDQFDSTAYQSIIQQNSSCIENVVPLAVRFYATQPSTSCIQVQSQSQQQSIISSDQLAQMLANSQSSEDKVAIAEFCKTRAQVATLDQQISKYLQQINSSLSQVFSADFEDFSKQVRSGVDFSQAENYLNEMYALQDELCAFDADQKKKTQESKIAKPAKVEEKQGEEKK